MRLRKACADETLCPPVTETAVNQLATTVLCAGMDELCGVHIAAASGARFLRSRADEGTVSEDGGPMTAATENGFNRRLWTFHGVDSFFQLLRRLRALPKDGEIRVKPANLGWESRVETTCRGHNEVHSTSNPD